MRRDEKHPKSLPLRLERRRRADSTLSGSPECRQDTQIPTDNFALENETNRAIEIKWVGRKGESILALTTQVRSIFTPFGQLKIANPSRLWRWDTSSEKFVNMSDVIAGEAILDFGGILQSPHDPDYIILIVFNRSKIHVSHNGGKKWQPIRLNFSVHTVKFHPTYKNYLMAISSTEELYVSATFGKEWVKIRGSGIMSFYWDLGEPKALNIYAAVDEKVQSHAYKFTLDKSLPPNVIKTQKIYSGIYRLLAIGKFIIVSSSPQGEKTPELRGLNISEDGGRTWNRGRLPESKLEDHYTIVDASEGFIVVHVAKGGSSTGTLYASDGSGAYFNPVLENHLYSGPLTDFYKVPSIKGTYMASVANEDNIIQSKISFDRCGHWQFIKADPKECQAENIADSECFLHVHSTYSASQGVNISQGILSNSNTKGLIIAHGNLGKGLKYDSIGVYITLDGGYNWRRILKGSYRYQMADFGNLIAAIPATKKSGGVANTLFYSMDWGVCWHKTQFTLNSDFHLTGLLIEPSLTSLSTSIWGYLERDNIWRVVFVDFTIPADRKCTSDDYEIYVPHIANDKQGCVFGQRERFSRRKNDRICYNGDGYDPSTSTELCPCTAEDFECDYGYKWRDESSTKCIGDSDFDVTSSMYCKPGQSVYNKTLGYRRIPGDSCKGGALDRFISTQTASCSSSGKKQVGIVTKPPSTGSRNGSKSGGGNGGKVAAGILIPLALIALIIGGLFVYKKYFKGGGEKKYDYRYSMLSQTEEDKANLLDDLDDEDDFKS